MVSVVRFTVNNFREQFFVMYYLERLSVLVQLREKGSTFGKLEATAESCCRCLPAVIFLFRSPFYLHSRVEFYTHFICTHGTQINYKCELSSKLFKDHLYCSLWSHLLSLTLNHTVYASYCFAFQALYCANRLIHLLYSNSLWFLRINTVCVYVCVRECGLVCMSSCPCVCMCACVRSVSTLWMKEVNVQLHGSLSFIDSQYVLLPG